MNKLKKGDEVIVIAGKDKGKRGVILSIVDHGEKVVVDGVNLAKKHTKADPNSGKAGGITAKAMPLHHSNVNLYDPTKQKASRVGIRTLNDGQRVRYFKASDQLVDVNK